mmetsp:Transcript_10028/g.18440  ORF Transcript_10028/g.18440 Transcript_10028/m.18440 type:complete len:215 (+) Transcript_10028:206-850(+)
MEILSLRASIRLRALCRNNSMSWSSFLVRASSCSKPVKILWIHLAFSLGSTELRETSGSTSVSVPVLVTTPGPESPLELSMRPPFGELVRLKCSFASNLTPSRGMPHSASLILRCSCISAALLCSVDAFSGSSSNDPRILNSPDCSLSDKLRLLGPRVSAIDCRLKARRVSIGLTCCSRNAPGLEPALTLSELVEWARLCSLSCSTSFPDSSWS